MKNAKRLILLTAILFVGCANKQRYQVTGAGEGTGHQNYMILDTYTGKYEVVYPVQHGVYFYDLDNWSLEFVTESGEFQTVRDKQSN